MSRDVAFAAIKLAMEGYDRSYLLRYLEEALVQTKAEIETDGLGAILDGIEFPVKGQYVTVAQLRSEVHGILAGTVLAAGTTYRVFVNVTAPRNRHDPGQHRRR